MELRLSCINLLIWHPVLQTRTTKCLLKEPKGLNVHDLWRHLCVQQLNHLICTWKSDIWFNSAYECNQVVQYPKPISITHNLQNTNRHQFMQHVVNTLRTRVCRFVLTNNTIIVYNCNVAEATAFLLVWLNHFPSKTSRGLTLFGTLTYWFYRKLRWVLRLTARCSGSGMLNSVYVAVFKIPLVIVIYFQKSNCALLEIFIHAFLQTASRSLDYLQ